MRPLHESSLPRSIVSRFSSGSAPRKTEPSILKRHAEDPHLQRLVLYSALENHRLSRRFFDTYIATRYETLAEHVRKGIRRGLFRKVEPVLAARSFLGMVIYHVLVQELFGGKRQQKFHPRRVAETLADTALNLEAMRPDMIVLRHSSSGACHLLSRICRSAIINAGAMCSAYSARRARGRTSSISAATASVSTSASTTVMPSTGSPTIRHELRVPARTRASSGAHRSQSTTRTRPSPSVSSSRLIRPEGGPRG